MKNIVLILVILTIILLPLSCFDYHTYDEPRTESRVNSIDSVSTDNDGTSGGIGIEIDETEDTIYKDIFIDIFV